MGTPAQATEAQYKYRGELVSVLDSTGAKLWQVARADGNPFWVRAEKLKVVKPPRKVHKYDAPAIAADPFCAWLLLQSVYICGDCPPQFVARFSDAYLAATGEEFNREAIESFSVSDTDKSWSYTLTVWFPKPPAELLVPFPVIPRGQRLEISNNEFVLGLLALGLRFGSNQPLRAQ